MTNTRKTKIEWNISDNQVIACIWHCLYASSEVMYWQTNVVESTHLSLLLSRYYHKIAESKCPILSSTNKGNKKCFTIIVRFAFFEIFSLQWVKCRRRLILSFERNSPDDVHVWMIFLLKCKSKRQMNREHCSIPKYKMCSQCSVLLANFQIEIAISNIYFEIWIYIIIYVWAACMLGYD